MNWLSHRLIDGATTSDGVSGFRQQATLQISSRIASETYYKVIWNTQIPVNRTVETLRKVSLHYPTFASHLSTVTRKEKKKKRWVQITFGGIRNPSKLKLKSEFDARTRSKSVYKRLKKTLFKSNMASITIYKICFGNAKSEKKKISFLNDGRVLSGSIVDLIALPGGAGLYYVYALGV